MNIFIWAPFLQKVGTTTNVENLINSLIKFSKKKSYKIDLINVFGEWDNYEFDDKRINKISLLNYRFLKNNKKKGFLISRFYTILIIILSAIPLARLLKEKNYDFLFVHLITSLPIFLASFLKKNNKLILNIAGFPKLTFLRSLYWKFFQRNIYRIVCPSHETKNLLLEKKIFNEKKLCVIKDPHISVKKIIKKKKIKLHQQFNLNRNIVSIGRLTKQKNYIFLLEGFKKILSLKNDLHLTIIGEGEDRKLIEDKIKNLEIMNSVTLEGYQDNVYKYLNNSLCYFSASLWEGPDLAMLDAASLNVPIICSDCKSGRKEFIDNNKRGYIFQTNNMSSLIETFEIFFKENKFELKKKLIESKKEVKNFTPFRYYLNLEKILSN
jgi:glycosyltransferase involved in cell wall biosynthesis